MLCYDIDDYKMNKILIWAKKTSLLYRCSLSYRPCFHLWFLEKFQDPADWLEARTTFTRSTAVWSAVGYIVGTIVERSVMLISDRCYRILLYYCPHLVIFHCFLLLSSLPLSFYCPVLSCPVLSSPVLSCHSSTHSFSPTLPYLTPLLLPSRPPSRRFPQ